MNQAMMEAARELGVRVKLTFPTGFVMELGGEDVVRFSVEEGADGALLPGAVLCAQMQLDLRNDAGQWRWGGSLRGERPLVGATAEIFLICGGVEMACGVFVVNSVSAGERSGRIRLSGCDSVAGEMAAAFVDGLTYPATLGQVWAHLVGQTRYVWSGVIPNGGAVIDSPPDWKGATVRKAAGWIAQAAGCFVRVGRDGALEMVGCMGGGAEEIGPEEYLSLEDGFESYGPVEALRVAFVGGEAMNFSEGDGTGETILVEGNPLFQQGAAGLDTLARGMLAQVRGLVLNRAELTWRGDPAVGVGSRIAVADTYGKSMECVVTRQTMTFDKGFSAKSACGVPKMDGAGVMRAITPEGGVNAGALVGTVDGGLLAVGSVTAKSMAARSVTAEKIAAGAVNAEAIGAGAVTAAKLAAEAVTAEKIAAGAVDAMSVEAVTAALEKLTAGDVSADELYAALGHVVKLAADSVAAGDLEADRLAAALAEVVSLRVAMGDFDFAAVKNLVSGAMVLEAGVADSVMVRNLAVTEANLLSATLGELVLRGEDGRYYEVAVGADGAVSAKEIAVDEGEIAAGEMEDGRALVETNVNIAELNAGTVKGAQAMLGEILTGALEAGKITAGEALIASATVPALYAASIRAMGGSMDLRANESVRIVVGEEMDAREIGNANLAAKADLMAADGSVAAGEALIAFASAGCGSMAKMEVGQAYAVSFDVGEDHGIGTAEIGAMFGGGEIALTPGERNSFCAVFIGGGDPVLLRAAVDGEARIGRVKVERGEKATDWSPAPGDPAEALDTGSGIYIHRDGIRLVSESTVVAVPDESGEDEALRIDGEGVHALRGEFGLVVSDSVVATQAAEAFAPATAGELAAVCENLSGRALTGMVEIDASALTGGVAALKGITGGGWVRIFGGALNQVAVENCTARVRIEGVRLSTAGEAVCARNACAEAVGCEVTASVGMAAGFGGRVRAEGCSGTCSVAGRAMDGGEIFFVDGAPYGVAECLSGGQIYSDGVLGHEEEEPEVVVPVIRTAVLTPVMTRTYDKEWRDGYWLWQGRYGTRTLNRGCMWFDGSAFSGKTVLSASLAMTRLSGAGGGWGVDIKVWGTSASGVGGAPAVGSHYATVNIGPGERKSVDVTAAVQALADGAIGGLMLYDGSTSNLSSSNNYTGCYAKLYGYDSSAGPVLTVTYEE